MINIILTGHGQFASGLYSNLKLIAGEQDNFWNFDFINGMTSEDISNEYLSVINKVDNICILTDIAGGTPFNEAVKLKIKNKDKNIEVISGTNVPMLLENIMNREISLNDFVDNIIKTGMNGVQKFQINQKKKIKNGQGI